MNQQGTPGIKVGNRCLLQTKSGEGAAVPVFLFCFRRSSDPDGHRWRVARRLLQIRQVRNELARRLRRTSWSGASTAAAGLPAHAGGSGSSFGDQATWCSLAPGWQIWRCIPAVVAPALVTTRRGAVALCSDSTSRYGLHGASLGPSSPWAHPPRRRRHGPSTEIVTSFSPSRGVQVLRMQRNEPCRQECGLALRLGLQGKTAGAEENSRQTARLHECGFTIMDISN